MQAFAHLMLHLIFPLTEMLCLTEMLEKMHSRLPITRTFANSNLALTRTTINFPWIYFILIYYNFTLGNSKPR